MATYLELRGLFNNSDLRNKIEVAAIIAAETIRGEDAGTTNHANRLIWAKWAFENTGRARDQLVKAVLAANESASTGAITGATDATIQTNVDAAVDVFADGTQGG